MRELEMGAQVGPMRDFDDERSMLTERLNAAHQERDTLLAEVERLRIDLDLMTGRADRATAACMDVASRVAQYQPACQDGPDKEDKDA